ncbi:MAG: DUF808 domain-containing protein [Pirellulaceae bacterium]
MASGLLLLLDDIASILDDVSVLTKVAAKKTAGILGDDLALNAQQVTGIDANRELPVVWAVAKGSLLNKLILVPSALLLSAVAPWAIPYLMIIGGTYLCFEGCEKLAHKFFHAHEEEKHQEEHEAHVVDETLDIVAVEKQKVRGAVRTDFILSAEIVVITLGSVADADFATRLMVLSAIGVLMTIGVYGLVAAIVKLDDLGLAMMNTSPDRFIASTRRTWGRWIVQSAPYLMKFLSIAGTAAMFLVGGGILAHEIPTAHHLLESVQHAVDAGGGLGSVISWLTGAIGSALLGIVAGTIVLLLIQGFQKFRQKSAVAE